MSLLHTVYKQTEKVITNYEILNRAAFISLLIQEIRD